MYALALAGAAGSPLCRCDLRGRRSTWCSPRGRMYTLALAGAAGSPPLCRCDLRAKLLVTNQLSSMWGYPVL